MTVFEKFEVLQTEYETAKTKLFEEIEPTLKELAAAFFVQFPAVDSFSWYQYTPYFNDGDACNFSVCADESSIELNEGDDDDDYEGDDDYDDEESEDELEFPDAEASEVVLTSEMKKSAKEAASELIANFDDEMLEHLYGDHVKITIHRDGTATTDEYYHD